MSKRILVLHSGGMDSTVCLYAAQAQGHEVVSLGIEYGRGSSVESIFAERQCLAREITRNVVKTTWAKPDRKIPADRAVEVMPKTISPAFLPARNMVFLSLACAHAVGLNCEEVQIGLNCVDFSGYPDCTLDFLNAFRTMADTAMQNGMGIAAPLINLSKPQIANRALQLGIGKWDTWSCYQPVTDGGALSPCGRCDACRLHDYAWDNIS